MRPEQRSTVGSVGNGGVAESPTSSVITGLCVSHETASVDDIESADRFDQTATLTKLLAREPVAEAFVLQTCHRVETYVVTEARPAGRRVLTDFTPDIDTDSVVEMDHEESLRHLLRVAAGLESVVLGEDQILGQVRDAYTDAYEVGAIGPVLETAVLKALRVGERARTETDINDGVCSIGSAAVALADQRCDLGGATALVIGAGQLGSLAANAFADSGIETLYVANRSVPRAEGVADDVDLGAARAVGLDALATVMAEADVVVSATSSDEYILDEDCLDNPGTTLIVDAARPRDVSPTVTSIEEVTLCDLCALESVVDEAKQRRQRAVEAVETIVDCEFDRLQEQYRRERADDVIAAMYERAEEMKSRQVSKTLARIESTGDDRETRREIIESLADALVDHLLADPTLGLREAAADGDWRMLEAGSRLLAPRSETEVDFERVPENPGGCVSPDRYSDS